MDDALKEIRVLEMANVISGPMTGMLLADLGAEVVKVELPGSGDIFRIWADQGVLSPSFAAYNRNKKSVTIDVRKEGGADCYLRLSATADVIIENFRPGILDAWGVGYEAVREKNPGIIYCSISGVGEVGPERDRPTYDAIAQAKSGLWSQLTDLKDPEVVGPPVCDQLAGLYAAYGILAALARRARDDQGERLHVSMLGAGLAFQGVGIANYLMQGTVMHHVSRARHSQSYAFQDRDGLPFGVHLSTPQKFWEGLATVAGRTDLIDDPRFRTKPDRMRNYDELHAEFAEAFKAGPRSEWLDALVEHGVPAAPINTIPEALEEPQVEHLGMVRRFGEGDRALELVGFPVEFEVNPCVTALPPPQIGEHTEQVLMEAGIPAEDIKGLREKGAI